MPELRNLFKGTIYFILICILTLIGLHYLAIQMSAGTSGFNLSAGFLAGQIIVIAFSYIAWYRKVNHNAAEMINIAKMRKMASNLMIHSVARSVIITALIGAAAVVFMLIDIFNLGIPAIYCYSSVIVMGVIGNLTLILLMTFVLPNRITGSY